MSRPRNPNRDEAKQKYLASGGKITTAQLAAEAGVPEARIRKWRSEDGWKADLEAQHSKRKQGAQPGNKNAVGAGAPRGNANAVTHGAYASVRLDKLPPDERDYIEAITLDSRENMLRELKLLTAKEMDLIRRIEAIEEADSNTLYIDRVVEMRVPKGSERLEKQKKKLEVLQREEDALLWDIETESGKAPTRQQEKKLERLQREIAALKDTTGDKEFDIEKSEYNISMQTVIKASPFERVGKLNEELNRVRGRIIKLFDSIKGYELESRRLALEEKRYNLSKQKLTGEFNIDPKTGDILDDPFPDDENPFN